MRLKNVDNVIYVIISIERLRELELLEKTLKVLDMLEYLSNSDILNGEDILEFTIDQAKEIGLIRYL